MSWYIKPPRLTRLFLQQLVGNKENTRAPSQYPKRRLIVRSREVSKPRDLYLELFDRSEIWQALRQHCCRCACQISKRYDNLKYQSRGFETSRDLTIRRLFGYWDGVQNSAFTGTFCRNQAIDFPHKYQLSESPFYMSWRHHTNALSRGG